MIPVKDLIVGELYLLTEITRNKTKRIAAIFQHIEYGGYGVSKAIFLGSDDGLTYIVPFLNNVSAQKTSPLEMELW